MSKRKSSEIDDKFTTIDDDSIDAKKQRVSVISQSIKKVKRFSVTSNASQKSTGSTKVSLSLVFVGGVLIHELSDNFINNLIFNSRNYFQMTKVPIAPPEQVMMMMIKIRIKMPKRRRTVV